MDPDLVARNREGQPESVRYEYINAMLLNEFLKEHRKVENLEAALKAVNKRLREQEIKIENVSIQIESHGPAPQRVVIK